MASLTQVQKLAELARIALTEKELATFAAEFDAILTYVGQIESLEVSDEKRTVPALRNVFREDGEPHEKGAYTEKIVEQFPAREGDFLSVKQIISYD